MVPVDALNGMFPEIPTTPSSCVAAFEGDPFGCSLVIYAHLSTRGFVSGPTENLLDVIVSGRDEFIEKAERNSEMFRIVPALCLIDAGLQEFSNNAILGLADRLVKELQAEQGRPMTLLSSFSYSATIVLWSRVVHVPADVLNPAKANVDRSLDTWRLLFLD